MAENINDELRKHLSSFAVADIATAAQMDLATVAGYMDGNNDLPTEDLWRLSGAMLDLLLRKSAMGQNQAEKAKAECDCPKCNLLRQIAQSVPGAEFRSMPGGGMLTFTTLIKSAPEPTPAPKRTFFQRLKAVLR